jgi:hypothetical protein
VPCRDFFFEDVQKKVNGGGTIAFCSFFDQGQVLIAVLESG